MITTLPLLFACVVIAVYASWALQTGLRNQILDGLRSAATGALLSLDNISRDSFRLVGDELYKGDFNVSQNMGAIDYYAESNDVEITFFYGDTRRATTIQDDKGERILGTSASADVVSTVLKQGKEYSSANVLINDAPYYGYYMPVSDSEGNIIGMAFAGRARAEISSYILNKVFAIIIIAVLNYISCTILSVWVANKRFLKPLYQLTTVASNLAKGDINQTIVKQSNDEFGDLTDSFSTLMENIAAQAHVAEKMADGDLTVSYTPVSEEDVMGNAMDKMLYDNNHSLSLIREASDKMAVSVNEISNASNSLAQGTTQQASAIEEITASIAGIADIAKINAQDADKANELMKNTKDEVLSSNAQMKHMISAMQDITDSSENIANIMRLIDDIASRTHIISLNASVEAARAGVHGKGFAVVAEEIRNLAAQSAEAARSSADIIEDSIKKTEIGSKLASETADSLKEILTSVENMTVLVNAIAEASSDQSTSASQANTGITRIADVVQTNSATSQQCAAASMELANMASQLKMAVDKYKLKVRR